MVSSGFGLPAPFRQVQRLDRFASILISGFADIRAIWAYRISEMNIDSIFAQVIAFPKCALPLSALLAFCLGIALL
jgi:hypothetical protein